MDARAIGQAAEILSTGRLQHARMGALPSDVRPTNEAEAYAVQNELHARLVGSGYGRVVGQKIGCTTPVMQEFLGIHSPCAGGVFESTVHRVNGAMRHDRFSHVGVESEIAVQLGADLPSEDAPYRRESVTCAVEAVMAAIEIVDDRWIDYQSVDTPSLIADYFFGAGCVLGESVRNWHGLALPAVSGSMSINDKLVGGGVGSDIMGHPFEALAWLANSMTERGAALRRGEFVLLGSIVETKWVEAGDLVVIEIEGLGRASAQFE